MPTTGKMEELLYPGVEVYLTENDKKERKTKFSLVAVKKNGIPRLIDTSISNNIFASLFDYIPDFKNWKIERKEFPLINSRFDFLLSRGDQKGLVEVKTCTILENKVSAFPDAISMRAVKHIKELVEAKKQGYIPFIVFLISGKANYFIPNYHLDPIFHKTFIENYNEINVLAMCYDLDDFLSINVPPDKVEIPINALNNFSINSGSYIIVYKLEKDEIINVGSLGNINFKSGYYLYTGSAKNNILLRTKRHKNKIKIKHWHIDYIHPPMAYMKTHNFINLNIECEIAKELSKLYSSVENFGSSDCKCVSHLFYCKNDPQIDINFINILFSLRFNEKHITY